MDHQEPALLIASCSGRIYTKSIDGTQNKSPIVSILTYPAKDYGNDRVRPDGGDWSQYPRHPYVNWTHRCPIGRGSVKHQILNNAGHSYPVAVGYTSFLYVKADVDGLDLRRRNPKTHRFWDKEPPYTIDDVLQVSSQAERLIRDDIAT